MQVNVRPNAVSALNCELCPLFAVSCVDAGLALFTLSRLREWTIVSLFVRFTDECYVASRANISHLKISSDVKGKEKNIEFIVT
jgi:hypothetical protein